MIAVDTNVLIRLLVQDDPDQGRQAERLLQDALLRGEDCFVSDPALCEIEWVLESCYDASRADVLAAIQEIVSRPTFLVEDREKLRRAMSRYQKGRGDFSDYLIGVEGEMRGARTTFTFDRVLHDEDVFTALR